MLQIIHHNIQFRCISVFKKKTIWSPSLYIELHLDWEKASDLPQPHTKPQVKDMQGQQYVHYSLGCGASCDSLDILASGCPVSRILMSHNWLYTPDCKVLNTTTGRQPSAITPLVALRTCEFRAVPWRFTHGWGRAPTWISKLWGQWQTPLCWLVYQLL